MKNIFDKIKKDLFASDFRKNVLTLLSATVISQALPIITSPLYLRIYKPEELGLYALFLSICGFIFPLATGSYDSAIMLPKDDKDSLNIMILVIMINFIVCIIFFLTFIFWGNYLLNLLKIEKLKNWLFIIPIILVLTVINQCFNYWYNRKKKYKIISTGKIMTSVIVVFLGLFLGLLGFREKGLIFSYIVGQISVFILFFFKFEDCGILKINELKIKNVLEQAKIYQNFPKYTLPQSFIDSVRENGIIFIISRFFGTAEIGFYSYALKVIKTPLNLIGSSISQVFYQHATSLKNNNINIWPLIKNTIKHLSFIAFPILLSILFFGPAIFSWIFGKNWLQAGIYSQIIISGVVILFIASSISTIPQIFGRQKTFMLMSIFYSIIIITGFYLFAVLLNNMKYSLGYLVTLNLIYGIIFLFWIKILCNKQEMVKK